MIVDMRVECVTSNDSLDEVLDDVLPLIDEV